MKKRILGYRTRIDGILEKNAPDTNWEELLSEHLVQIGFFQHERLIHLIVTVLFALLAVMSIIASLLIPEWVVLLLCLMFFVLLIPYIRHYYILENGVQKLYEYYDEIGEGKGK